MGLRQDKKLLHNKGNHQQNEKTTYQMGEDIFDKELVFKIYTELIQLNTKKQKKTKQKPKQSS